MAEHPNSAPKPEALVGASNPVAASPPDPRSAAPTGRLLKGRSSPKTTGSLIGVVHGSASVKAYPIMEDELWALGGLGIAATFFFSVASGLVGFYFDTAKDLDLADTANVNLAYWRAVKDLSLAGSAFCALLALVFIVLAGIKVRRVINRTTFD
jgi:hypothetical protein